VLFSIVDKTPWIGIAPAQPEQIGFNHFAIDLPNREELENVKAHYCLQKK
jgi:catechol-2,3-dioxygenase